jgi:uncharacterized lipoprotein YddW (UPF0748 family)
MLLLCSGTSHVLGAEELRGFWVDAFHGGFKSSAEVTKLVADARAGKFNALFVQVRKRGDAYYSGGLEPRATDIVGSTFDPLQDLVTKAHTGSPRIDVHAWIVTYNIWQLQTAPTQPTHPYNLHQDWLTQKADGTRWDGSNYAFDPGHPEVQKHTYNVCMDLVNRYALDGLHFDYVRYTDAGSSVGNQPYGYNPESVARFQKLTNRTDIPAATDSQWLQFRRDQVTSLVRKVYLNAWKQRPAARISAALISYGSAPVDQSNAVWQGRDAYGRVLQDWRSWMQEGILDLGVPMIYRDYSVTARATEFGNWCAYTRDNQFSRAAAAGVGIYLNQVEGTIDEIQVARTPSVLGRTLSGMIGYSYATYCRQWNPITGVYADNYVSQPTFLNALTDPATAATYDPGGTPVYGTTATIPAMPWKTSTTKGHAMGYVRNAGLTVDFDGVSVSLSGPLNRILKTDATGFFGAVDLPVGSYVATVTVPGYYPASQVLTVTGANVSEWSPVLIPLPFAITAVQWNEAQQKITLTWNSLPERTYRIDSSTDMADWPALASSVPSAGYTTIWTSAALAPGAGRKFFRVSILD